MKILIQYKSSVKVRDIENVSELNNAVEQIFNLKKGCYFLQIYDDNDFNEYIDLEDFQMVKNKSKIKVIDIVDNVVETVLENNSTETVGENAVPCDIEIRASDVEVLLDLKVNQWPEFINILTQDFSKELLNALDNQKSLNWVQSSELTTHLANYAYQYKKYPNKSERLQICTALINKFPYLKNDIGSGTGGWEIRILNKLKKIRQSDPSLEVQLNRQKRKSETSRTPKNIKLNPERGELNWSPDHFPGENDNSQKIHMQLLNEESKKSASFQNQNTIKSLMNLTYSFRRNKINNKISIKQLMDEYPIFFQENEQYNEFERLTSIRIADVFYLESSRSSKLLLDMFLRKQSHILKSKQNEIERILNCYKDENIEKIDHIKQSLGLSVLPLLFKEKIEHFVQEVNFLFFLS